MTELLQALWFSGFVVFMWWATWEDEHHLTRRKLKRFWIGYRKELRAVIREIAPVDDVVCFRFIIVTPRKED